MSERADVMTGKLFNRCIAVCVVALFFSIGLAVAQGPKYIFLMIGDGMGSSQRTLAEYYKNYHLSKAGPYDIHGYEKLVMNSFPVCAETTTFSRNFLITDSAAAGTAFACGCKTDNGFLGVDDSGMPRKSIAEMAHKEGMKVGIVSSIQIDSATPAVFYAHQPERTMYREIALELPESGFEYFAAGSPSAVCKDAGDREEIRAKAERLGYTIIEGKEGFAALGKGAGKVWVTPGTFGEAEYLEYAIDADGEEPSLSDFTAKGIELLDGEEGFFMMVEGGAIDWACHAHDPLTVVKEVLAFDDAVSLAFGFYKEHPAETLIVVTGDHETGGLGIGSKVFGFMPGKLDVQKISGRALGEKLEAISNDQTSFKDILTVVQGEFGLGDISDDEVDLLKVAFEKFKADQKEEILYHGGNPIVLSCCHIVSERAKVGWTTSSHSGARVVTTAIGPGSEKLGGYNDHTDIAKVIGSLVSKEINLTP